MRRTSIRIQERDRRLTRDAFLYRVVRRDDLVSLGHFGSVPRCNYRLKQLVGAGWLRRIESVNWLTIHQGLYAPGTAAARYLVQCLDVPHEEVARQCTAHEGPLLVEHSLRVLDFRLLLSKEAPQAKVVVEDLLCECECLHEFTFKDHPSVPWSQVVMKPDGYFRACHLGNGYDFFVEIDLGHVSLPRFEQKLCRYEKYVRSGAFSDAYGSREFTVLTVTTGERRLGHLAELPHPSFDHFVTSWSRIVSKGIFKCHWTDNSSSLISLNGLFAKACGGGTIEILP